MEEGFRGKPEVAEWMQRLLQYEVVGARCGKDDVNSGPHSQQHKCQDFMYRLDGALFCLCPRYTRASVVLR